MKPVHSVSLRRDVHILHLHQPDRVVETSILVEIRTYRNHVKVLAVIANDLKGIDSLFQSLGDIDSERCVTAFMGCQLDTIHLDNRGLGSPFEQDIMRMLDIARLEIAAICGRSPVVTRGMAIFRVIGMRDRYGSPIHTILTELPS